MRFQPENPPSLGWFTVFVLQDKDGSAGAARRPSQSHQLCWFVLVFPCVKGQNVWGCALSPLKQIIEFCSLRTHVCTRRIPPGSSVPQSDSSAQDVSNKVVLLVFTSDRPLDACLMLPPQENSVKHFAAYCSCILPGSIVFRILFKHVRIVAFNGFEVILIW